MRGKDAQECRKPLISPKNSTPDPFSSRGRSGSGGIRNVEHRLCLVNFPTYADITDAPSARARSRTASATAIHPSTVVGRGARLFR
jgi:hypothetical protein